MASLSFAKFLNRDTFCTLLPAAKFWVEEFQLGTGYTKSRTHGHSNDNDVDVRRLWNWYRNLHKHQRPHLSSNGPPCLYQAWMRPSTKIHGLVRHPRTLCCKRHQQIIWEQNQCCQIGNVMGKFFHKVELPPYILNSKGILVTLS